jgi:hypothetical protein
MSIGCAGKLAGHGIDMRVLKGTLPEPIKKGLPNNATFVPAESIPDAIEVTSRPKVG